MGHAFEHSLIDVLVRYHRMIGRNTLWLPGTDHASIAVSTILDKELQSQGKTRQDVGREAYLERAWQWKEESGVLLSVNSAVWDCPWTGHGNASRWTTG